MNMTSDAHLFCFSLRICSFLILTKTHLCHSHRDCRVPVQRKRWCLQSLTSGSEWNTLPLIDKKLFCLQNMKYVNHTQYIWHQMMTLFGYTVFTEEWSCWSLQLLIQLLNEPEKHQKSIDIVSFFTKYILDSIKWYSFGLQIKSNCICHIHMVQSLLASSSIPGLSLSM